MKTIVGLFAQILLLSVLTIVAHAQKLPNKQEASIWAPANIKVDGKATEWDNNYQAYNSATEVFYNIANDDENIYLVIHATKSRIIEKIIEGGISFTVNNSGKKNDKKRVVVVFPLMTLDICKGVLITAGKTLSGKTLDDDNKDISASLNSTALSNKNSSMLKANKELIMNLKEIKISGIRDIIDTIPGVGDRTPYYRTLPLRFHQFKIIKLLNKDNINAMVQFDKDGSLTYELSVPVKYLNMGATGNQSFFYNVTINARGEDGRPGNVWSRSRAPGHPLLNPDMEAATDFWGEYTLAKKP